MDARHNPCIVKSCRNNGTLTFPSDDIRRRQWIEAITYLKPRKLSKYTRICTAHFLSKDFNVTPLSVLNSEFLRKRLKKTAIPTIFPWNVQNENALITPKEVEFNVKEVTATYSRVPKVAFAEELPYLEHLIIDRTADDPLKTSAEDLHTVVMGADTVAEVEDIFYEETIMTTVESDIVDSRDFNTDIGVQTECVQKEEVFVQTENSTAESRFTVKSYQNNDRSIHFFTGLQNYDKFKLVFEILGPCAYELNYYYGNPPRDIDVIDQFFITLLILRRHNPFEYIAAMYKTTIKQIYNIFVTWIRFMSLQFRNIDLWIDKEKNTAYMPLGFFETYPNTRLIIDATEFPIQKPKLPLAQQITFSTYKNKNTVKALIGITPSGLISYVSPCYGGSATDRQIIERSEILKKFDYRDEIMVDKGLNVQDIFLPYGVKVNMPSFFKKGNQIDPMTLTSNRKVASKRVHVERVIGLLKTYKILTEPMNHTETMLSSDIVYICAMLVNFRPSIINRNA